MFTATCTLAGIACTLMLSLAWDWVYAGHGLHPFAAFAGCAVLATLCLIQARLTQD